MALKHLLCSKLGSVIKCLSLDKLAACVGLFEPKVISMLDGGLGSQMKQFAVGYNIAKAKGLPLYLETNFFRSGCGDLNGVDNRKFLLMDVFPKIRELYGERIIPPGAFRLFRNLFTDKYIKRHYYEFSEKLLDSHSVYLGSYYSHSRFIEDSRAELQDLFEFHVELDEYERGLESEIQACPDSCFIHIRKGDYVGTKFEVCGDAYYLEAVEKMHGLHPGVHFFIFSNDEAYAKDLLCGCPYPCTYVTGRSEVSPQTDLYLMTLFRHGIISNSCFSSMARILSRHDLNGGTTIMPDEWIGDEKLATISGKAMQYKGWIQVKSR